MPYYIALNFKLTLDYWQDRKKINLTGQQGETG